MSQFAIRNLAVLAYAQGFTLWHYKLGLATVADAMAPGFFNDMHDMCCDGDMVMVSNATSGATLVLRCQGKTVIAVPQTIG